MTMFQTATDEIDYIGYFDGACGPRNPGGSMGFGAAVYRGRKLRWETCGFRPAAAENTNNVAEYIALNELLDWFIGRRLCDAAILLRGDSNLVIQQCFGSWKLKRGFYRPFAEEALAKLQQFSVLSGEWVPREQNTYADKLSKRELLQRGIRAI